MVSRNGLHALEELAALLVAQKTHGGGALEEVAQVFLRGDGEQVKESAQIGLLLAGLWLDSLELAQEAAEVGLGETSPDHFVAAGVGNQGPGEVVGLLGKFEL